MNLFWGSRLRQDQSSRRLFGCLTFCPGLSPSRGSGSGHGEIFPAYSLLVSSAPLFDFDSILQALGIAESLLSQGPEPALKSCGFHFPGYSADNTSNNCLLCLGFTKAHPSASSPSRGRGLRCQLHRAEQCAQRRTQRLGMRRRTGTQSLEREKYSPTPRSQGGVPSPTPSSEEKGN